MTESFSENHLTKYCASCNSQTEHEFWVLDQLRIEKCKSCLKITRSFRKVAKTKFTRRTLSKEYVSRNFEKLAKLKKFLEVAGYQNEDAIKYSKMLNFAFRGCSEVMEYFKIRFIPEHFGNEAICMIEDSVSVSYLPKQKIDTSKTQLTNRENNLAKEFGSRLSLARMYNVKQLTLMDLQENFVFLSREYFTNAIVGLEEALSLDATMEADRIESIIRHEVFSEMGFLKNKLNIKAEEDHDHLYYECSVWRLYTNFCANMILCLARKKSKAYSYHIEAESLLIDLAKNQKLNTEWDRFAHEEIILLKMLVREFPQLSNLRIYISHLEQHLKAKPNPLNEIKVKMIQMIMLVAHITNSIEIYQESNMIEEHCINGGEFDVEDGNTLVFGIEPNSIQMTLVNQNAEIISDLLEKS